MRLSGACAVTDCFHFPGFHFGPGFLSHSHIMCVCGWVKSMGLGLWISFDILKKGPSLLLLTLEGIGVPRPGRDQPCLECDTHCVGAMLRQKVFGDSLPPFVAPQRVRWSLMGYLGPIRGSLLAVSSVGLLLADFFPQIAESYRDSNF